MTEPTDLKKLRGDLAENEASRESARFDPSFFYELRQERDRQIGQWGPNHDREHTLYDWVVFLNKFTGRAAQAAMNGNQHEFERQMVKVAALAAAARLSVYPPEALAMAAEEDRHRARVIAERAA